jgi:hypothetical protein
MDAPRRVFSTRLLPHSPAHLLEIDRRPEPDMQREKSVVAGNCVRAAAQSPQQRNCHDRTLQELRLATALFESNDARSFRPRMPDVTTKFAWAMTRTLPFGISSVHIIQTSVTPFQLKISSSFQPM